MTAPPDALPDQPALDHAAVRQIVLGILLAMFLAALDQTIIATALPTIGRDLGDVENLSWVVTAYLLTATTVTPLYGKLSDIHGRRTMLLIGIGIFAIGSLACALAPTMMTLILGRALQGLGGGGLISLAQTIIADVVSPAERGRYQGYIGTVFAGSSIGGPVLGGFFAEHLHWSLIFWINLPLSLLAFQMTYTVLKQLPRHERPHRLDIAGAALMMLATIALLLALTWGGTRYPWGSAAIVGLLASSGVLWVLFVVRLLTAREPFLPLPVLLDPVVGFGTASVSWNYGAMIALTIFVPLYFEVVLGLSASGSGLALIPPLSAVVFGSTLIGPMMSRMRHYKRMPMAGLTLAVVALIALAVQPNGYPIIMICALLAVVGFGIGSLFPVTTVSIQNAVLSHQLGTATAAMNFFRSLSGALLVSGFGAIVLGGVGSVGHGGITIDVLAEAGRHGADLVGAFRWVFGAAAACLAAALVLLTLMEERPLRGAASTASEAPLAAE
ncbi:MAG TPA: MDR family MFS transporter [Xanthobacteraceae bacterium]|jgi:EmrB/QacA subfamily drug resistance transporter|nr:MDR family MFS transporter [Xanthobacteraceae bacterium]